MQLNRLILLLILIQSPVCFAKKTGTLSIILDDMGYNCSDFQALSLPKQITFSVLPFTPLGEKLAQKAQQQGRALLLHMPMQAKNNNEKLGQGALMLDMNEQKFKAALRRALHYLPEAQGINNHMGSALTERFKPMRWTMEVLQAQGLYFLDSRTSRQTIAESTAKLLGIPTLRRHIFLDNIRTEQAMNKQLQQAIKLAQSHDRVIIIAHPYPETLHFLKKKLQSHSTEFKLIALNQLFTKTQRLAMAQKKSEFQQTNNLLPSDNLSSLQ